MSLPLYEKHNPIAKVKNTLAVLSGKGGVGKSTVAVHLALTLNKLKERVGILDADLYGPSLRKMLPEEIPAREKEGIYFPAVAQGIKIVSMAYFRNENESLAMRAPFANQIIGHFLNQVAWGEIDWLIIDFPPGTGDIGLSLCQKSSISGAVVVTTPQEVAMLDVKKTIDMLVRLQVPILGVVENMSAYVHPTPGEVIHFFGKDGGKRLAADVNVPFLGEIPLDPQLAKRCDEGCREEDAYFEREKGFSKIVCNIQGHLKLNSSPPAGEISERGDDFFVLTFRDGKKRRYSFNLIQKNCPCAGCIKEKSISEGVRVTNIALVGRYALSFSFTSGCSHGIYSFDFLSKLGDETAV